MSLRTSRIVALGIVLAWTSSCGSDSDSGDDGSGGAGAAPGSGEWKCYGDTLCVCTNPPEEPAYTQDACTNPTATCCRLDHPGLCGCNDLTGIECERFIGTYQAVAKCPP